MTTNFIKLNNHKTSSVISRKNGIFVLLLNRIVKNASLATSQSDKNVRVSFDSTVKIDEHVNAYLQR